MEISEYENIYTLENTYWWYKILDSLLEDTIKKYFQNNKIKILDVGCGTGRVLEMLNPFGEVEGIDSSPEAIKFCLLRGQKNVKLMDVNKLGSQNKKYDLIVTLDVLYHETILNVDKVISTFYEALNPNGILILNLPAFDILKRNHDRAVGGVRRFKKSTFSKILIKSGFEITALTYRLPILFLTILLTKYIFEKNNQMITSDLKKINPALNKFLYKFHLIENKLINVGINMPFGSSLFVVARKHVLIFLFLVQLSMDSFYSYIGEILSSSLKII